MNKRKNAMQRYFSRTQHKMQNTADAAKSMSPTFYLLIYPTFIHTSACRYIYFNFRYSSENANRTKWNKKNPQWCLHLGSKSSIELFGKVKLSGRRSFVMAHLRGKRFKLYNIFNLTIIALIIETWHSFLCRLWSINSLAMRVFNMPMNDFYDSFQQIIFTAGGSGRKFKLIQWIYECGSRH